MLSVNATPSTHSIGAYTTCAEPYNCGDVASTRDYLAANNRFEPSEGFATKVTVGADLFRAEDREVTAGGVSFTRQGNLFKGDCVDSVASTAVFDDFSELAGCFATMSSPAGAFSNHFNNFDNGVIGLSG